MTAPISIAAVIMNIRTFASSASATGINSRDPNSFGQGGEFFVDLGLIGRNSAVAHELPLSGQSVPRARDHAGETAPARQRRA